MSKIKRLFIITLALFTLSVSGCSSLVYRSLSGPPSGRPAPPYPGVATDVSLIPVGFSVIAEQDTMGEKALYGVYALGITTYSIIDLPFSAVFDTLLLPFDLPHLIKGDSAY